MKVHVYILCYNEEVVLPHTIEHYRRNFSDCEFTIYDNKSTDESRNIAKDLSCNLIEWESNNEIDDYKYKDIKNACWKEQKEGWAIVIDMDEWLAVNDEILNLEECLKALKKKISKGGRIIVISFHSLEDKIVKNTFKEKINLKFLQF